MKRWSHKHLDLEHHCIANQYIMKQNHQQVNVLVGIVDSVPDLCAVVWGSNPKLGGSCRLVLGTNFDIDAGGKCDKLL